MKYPTFEFNYTKIINHCANYMTDKEQIDYLEYVKGKAKEYLKGKPTIDSKTPENLNDLDMLESMLQKSRYSSYEKLIENLEKDILNIKRDGKMKPTFNFQYNKIMEYCAELIEVKEQIEYLEYVKEKAEKDYLALKRAIDTNPPETLNDEEKKYFKEFKTLYYIYFVLIKNLEKDILRIKEKDLQNQKIHENWLSQNTDKQKEYENQDQNGKVRNVKGKMWTYVSTNTPQNFDPKTGLIINDMNYTNKLSEETQITEQLLTKNRKNSQKNQESQEKIKWKGTPEQLTKLFELLCKNDFLFEETCQNIASFISAHFAFKKTNQDNLYQPNVGKIQWKGTLPEIVHLVEKKLWKEAKLLTLNNQYVTISAHFGSEEDNFNIDSLRQAHKHKVTREEALNKIIEQINPTNK